MTEEVNDKAQVDLFRLLAEGYDAAIFVGVKDDGKGETVRQICHGGFAPLLGLLAGVEGRLLREFTEHLKSIPLESIDGE